MHKNAPVSGAALETPLGGLRRSLRPLVARSFVPSAIAASRSQFYLLARSDRVRVRSSRSQFFLCRLPLLNSWNCPPYMRFVELTNYGYFCILCPHTIYVCVTSVIFLILLLVNENFVHLLFFGFDC